MTSEFIPYATPAIGQEEIAAVAEVLRSGWLTTGPRTKEFEESFAEFLGGGGLQCIAVNSATAGLHLALEAIGLGPGDEVIAPTLTFTATVEVVRYLGADPVLVDVDPVTLNLDPERVREAITPRTRAIIPVHYGGLACDMNAIFRLARGHGLKVIEDAAHALPTTHERRLIGTLESDATVFSFYANKTMTTGEGGMIVTRDAKVADRMRIMRTHGIDRDAFDRFVSRRAAWYYEVVAPGFKYNLTDIAAAIGLQQLRKVWRFSQRRSMLAERYLRELSDLPLTLPANAPNGDLHAWHIFAIRVAELAPVSRDETIDRLTAAGIGTSVHYVPLHRQPYWRDRYRLTPDMFPNADMIYGSTLSIPLSSAMTDAAQSRVIAALRDILG